MNNVCNNPIKFIRIGLSIVNSNCGCSGDSVVKPKVLMIFLILFMLISVVSLSGCLSQNSAPTESLYDSNNGDSIYNSTNNTPLEENGEPLKIIEYTKVPIGDAYSRDKLQNINVSDDILKLFHDLN